MIENFFYHNKFCVDLSDLMDHLNIDDKRLEDLDDHWYCEIERTRLESIFEIDANMLGEILCNLNEHRLKEDFDITDQEKVIQEKVIKAINDSCDFHKLKELLPKYYYPTREIDIITRQDLISYCKNCKKKMKYTDDLSWSNIVNLIQHEEVKGADLIDVCAIELEELRKEIAELENMINIKKSRERRLLQAGQNVAKHLNKQLPLAVKRQDYIVVLSKDDITIERNLI